MESQIDPRKEEITQILAQLDTIEQKLQSCKSEEISVEPFDSEYEIARKIAYLSQRQKLFEPSERFSSAMIYDQAVFAAYFHTTEPQSLVSGSR